MEQNTNARKRKNYGYQSLALCFSSVALASWLIDTVRVSGPSPKKMTSTVTSSLVAKLAKGFDGIIKRWEKSYRYLREYGLGRVNKAQTMSLFLPPIALRTR